MPNAHQSTILEYTYKLVYYIFFSYYLQISKKKKKFPEGPKWKGYQKKTTTRTVDMALVAHFELTISHFKYTYTRFGALFHPQMNQNHSKYLSQNYLLNSSISFDSSTLFLSIHKLKNPLFLSLFLEIKSYIYIHTYTYNCENQYNSKTQKQWVWVV